MAANAYIVCKAGVEWNQIIAVYLDGEQAQTECDRLELLRLSSDDIFDRLSQYVVETHPISGRNSNGR